MERRNRFRKIYSCISGGGYASPLLCNRKKWVVPDEKREVDKKLIVYCSFGKNSVSVTQELELQGHEAHNLKSGCKAWLLKYCEELSAEEQSALWMQIM